MGRPRKKDTHLPPCVHFVHGAHWHIKRNVWTRLPKDGPSTLTAAMEAYARLFQTPQGEIDKFIDEGYAAIRKAKVKPLSKATIKCYDRAARNLKKILRNFSLDQVKPKHVAAMKREMSTRPGIFNQLMSFGRQVFDYWLEEQLIESNPFTDIKRHPQGRRTRLIEWDEWWKIHGKSGHRLQLIMDGLYLTDQRISDLLNIDERDGIEEGVYFKTSKTGKELIVRWNDDLRAWWVKCRAQHSKVTRVAFADPTRARPIFRTKHGTKPAYRTIYDQWVVACDLAGVKDCNLHDNRAFSATEMKRQSGGGEEGEKAAQLLLGHGDRRTTKIYLRGREIDIVDGPRLIKSA